MATAVADACRVMVIGHRGASGYRPENTLAAHELAVRLGADRVECDVVPTADGVLVVRHESDVTHSTDVASRPDLAALRRPRAGEGSLGPGWFTEDLTLDQVRTLRAVEPRPSIRQATTVYDGVFGVPTLAELLALVARLRAETGRDVGVAVEVKDPAVFAPRGLDVGAMLLQDLSAPGAAGVPVVVQCFDPRFLVRLHDRSAGAHLQLVQLVTRRPQAAPLGNGAGAPGWPTARQTCSDAGLAEVARYAQVLAVHKDMVLPVARDGSWGVPTDLVDRAHAAGLDVHVYSTRNENAYLPPALRVGSDPGAHGRALEEYVALARAGVDGVFSDHPDTAVEAARLVRAPGALACVVPVPA